MRLLDLVGSLAGLILLSPVFLAVAAAVKADGSGPVFYRASRVGRRGVPFRLYKFRSMVADADRMGPGITAAEDPRITPVGRVLRRTKLDELPQLINVFKGDMSFVGPRPEDPRYVAGYSPRERRVLEARPGLTSVASLRYRNESELLRGPDWESLYRNRVLPEKLSMELEYLARRTLRSDLRLILATLLAVAGRGEGWAVDG